MLQIWAIRSRLYASLLTSKALYSTLRLPRTLRCKTPMVEIFLTWTWGVWIPCRHKQAVWYSITQLQPLQDLFWHTRIEAFIGTTGRHKAVAEPLIKQLRTRWRISPQFTSQQRCKGSSRFVHEGDASFLAGHLLLACFTLLRMALGFS